MNYRELSKELGISSQYLSRLIELNMISDSTAPMLRSYDGEELEIIRKCCLFSMLGVSLSEYAGISDGSLDFKDTLKKHVESIANDESNNSKAAIVLQNIRRDNDSLDSVNALSYLQHIRELKAQGGIFYDVNTLKLSKNEAPVETKKQGSSFRDKLRAAFSWGDADEDADDAWSRYEKKQENKEEKRNSEYYYSSEKDLKSEELNTGSYNSTGNAQDVGKDGNVEHAGNAENIGSLENAGSAKNTESGQYFESNYNTENGQNPDNTGNIHNTDNRQGVNPEQNPSQGAYDDKWSPYLNRGFGASNMGSGNWQGWSPGYGTYSKPIGARERINNGEVTCPHPVRRFIARTLDATIVTFIGSAVLRLGFRVNVGISLKMMAYCEIIFWLFEMLLEPLLLTSIGTTPGKWVMGLRVRDSKTKQKLELKQAYIRSLKLAWHGFGLMIPIFTVFKRVMSYLRCRINDTMPWDNGIDVELVDENNVRVVLVIIAIVITNLFDEVVSRQALIPENKGNITKDQFYTNVVELMEYTGYAGDIPEFEIEERNGYVQSVTLKYYADGPEKNRYDEMYIGFLAFAGASEGSNGIRLMMTSALGRLKSYSDSFQEQYCDVTIINNSDSGIKDSNSYSLLFATLYGTQPEIPSFDQTFKMIRN